MNFVGTDPELTGPDVTRMPGTAGHVVLAEGEDATGDAAVAVWHASAAGVPVGAWIEPVTRVATEPATAHRLLRLTSRRALIGWDTAVSERLLTALAGWAGQELAGGPVTVSLPAALAEIRAHRRTYERAVEAHHEAAGTKPNPLVWRRDVPPAGSWSEFSEAARLRRPVAARPVAADALHQVRAVAWVAELWHQTETVRARRGYLSEQFGPPTALPPQWSAQLRRAATAAGPAADPAAAPAAGPAADPAVDAGGA